MSNVSASPAVLVIEPDEDIVNIITTVLSDDAKIVLGFESFSSEVMNTIHAYQIGLVIIAFRANGEDAIDALGMIKSVISTPVIALSCDVDISEKSVENGFDGHITKPFDIDELVRLVSSFIKEV